jgi:peptidoglycan-associated lipoprotein
MPSMLAVALLLSACASNPQVDVPSSQSLPLPPPPAPTTIPGQDSAVGTVQPVPQASSIDSGLVSGAPITRNSINDPSHPLARRIIFFDYNSAAIGQDSIALLEQHAEYLSRFRDVRVRLEGHTDERGSREFNIALGDNRSRSVARVLQLQGVDAGQFSTLSYGEEVPLDEGTGESAWQRNRRVEIVYEGLN